MSKLTNFRVAVLATDGFEEAELTEPVKALKDAGAEVTVLSLKPGQIQGVRHDLDKTVKVKVDRAIGNVSAEDFDALHLPGGTVNADTLRMVPEVQTFLRAMEDAGKPQYRLTKHNHRLPKGFLQGWLSPMLGAFLLPFRHLPLDHPWVDPVAAFIRALVLHLPKQRLVPILE